MIRLKEIQANRKRMVDGIIGQVDERETLVQGLVAASHKPDEGKSTQLMSISSTGNPFLRVEKRVHLAKATCPAVGTVRGRKLT